MPPGITSTHHEHGKATLAAVAAAAGVSRATAARVVNDSRSVRPAARAAVEQAIRTLGYVPNRATRALVTRRNRTGSIALLVCEPESRVLVEPYFAGMLRGISQALSEADIQLVFMMVQTSAERLRVERYFRQGRVDGALLTSVHGDDTLPEYIQLTGTPTVLCGRPTRPLDMSYVDVDNVGGARDAVRHLVARGRTQIATIAGPADMAVGVDRLEGYREALREAALGPRRELTEHGDFSQDSGFTATRELLHRAPGIDAIFAASDLMAAGALRALRAAGRSVPRDVAVVGFDDAGSALSTEPPLTTVRQPLDQMGRRMAQLLLDEIADPGVARRAVIFDTELIVRDST